MLLLRRSPADRSEAGDLAHDLFDLFRGGQPGAFDLARRIDGVILTDPAEALNCDAMKNLTVSLDDETYRRARMIAAQRETSVSALVKRFLTELASGETEFERPKRLEQSARDRIVSFNASDRLSRDEIHERRY